MAIALAGTVLAGCYTGAPANRDVQAVWRGRQRAEIVDRWGEPAARPNAGPPEVLVWSYTTNHVELPGGHLAVEGNVTPGAADVHVDAELHPGEFVHTRHDAAAIVAPAGFIDHVEGPALHWGPPNDVNLHWGTIFGGHVGMGRLDSTPTALPGGGVYVGGMLSPTLGLVGVYDFASGSADAGGAIAMAGGVAAQWWPVNRFWLRAGPALILAMDPGFMNTRLEPGLTGAASYAFVKVGTFVVDARFELAAGTSTTFGTVGVGVDLN